MIEPVQEQTGAPRITQGGDGRKEFQLLICAAKGAFDPGSASETAALIGRGIDWDILLRMAKENAMLPLLHLHLEGLPARLVPARVRGQIKYGFDENHRNNLFLTAELLRLLKSFASYGVEAIPYKGPALAVAAYGNIALRRFADLDILVRRRDVPLARRLLEERGYEPELKIPPAHEEAFQRVNYVRLFNRHDVGCVVELHWAVAPRSFSFPLDTERLWERLDYVELAGERVPSLSREDQLLLLCVHGAKDLWDRLEWVCGVAGVLHASAADLDWPRLLRDARSLGAQRMLLLGLSLARDLLGAPLAHEALRAIESDRAVKRLADTVRARLMQPWPEISYSLPTRMMFHARVRERARDKARFCVRLLLTVTHEDWEFASLPPRLSFLYLVLRPVRLARKYWVRQPEG